MDNVTKAYIAGFFDGEGSVSFVWRTASKNGKKYGKLYARISQNDRRVLDWICRLTGSGSVHARRRGNPKHKIQHEYVLAYEAARKFLAMILPFLRVKAKAVKEKLKMDAKFCRRQGRWDSAPATNLRPRLVQVRAITSGDVRRVRGRGG